MKNTLSAVFAIIAALIFLYLIAAILQMAFKAFITVMGLITVIVIALPLYVIIRKKLFK